MQPDNVNEKAALMLSSLPELRGMFLLWRVLPCLEWIIACQWFSAVAQVKLHGFSWRSHTKGAVYFETKWLVSIDALCMFSNRKEIQMRFSTVWPINFSAGGNHRGL